MRELHLFAGAGGGILGGMLLGHTCVCAVEIEPYCRKVLLSRQRDGILPKFPIWDDVRTFDGKPWRGLVDVVCGGFPCQRFSSATRGRANAEDQWPEMLRVIGEVQPAFVFAENVSKRAVEIAGDDLDALDYSSTGAEIRASDVGADHIRKRYWLFAHSDRYGQLLRAKHAEMERVPSMACSVWESDPDKTRMDDGMAYWMERLSATGNGQVPAVVRLAWEILSEA